MKFIFKKYFPLFILFTCVVLYSLRYDQLFVIPVDDESLYSMGEFWHSFAWSPGYKLYYYILNFFTDNSFTSLYYNYFFISMVFIPAATYLSLRNLKFNIQSSALVAILALFAEWNSSAESTKIQLFNYLWILGAFNLRWYWQNNINNTHRFLSKKNVYSLFYTLILLSLFIRQDNIIILLIVFLWDLVALKTNLSRKIIFFITGITSFYLIKNYFLFNIFNEIFNPVRSAYTLMDHIWFNNRYLFSYYEGSGLPWQFIFDEFFKKPKSLIDVIVNRPDIFLHHVQKNFFAGDYYLLKASNIIFKEYWLRSEILRPIFIVLTAIIFSKGISEEDQKKINYKEIILFSLVLSLKCLTISILLNWWLKYYFELSIIIMIWLIIIAVKLRQLFAKVFRHHFFFCLSQSFTFSYLIWIFIPYAFIFFFKYQPNAKLISVNLHKIIPVLEKENAKYPIKNLLSGMYFNKHRDYNPRLYNIFFHLEFHDLIKKNFKDFLDQEKIDTIIMYDTFRKRLYQQGYDKEIKDFEKNFSLYGYEIKYNYNNNHILYRKIK